MSKEDVINYVMTTPSNPNKAVLEGMLDSIINAGGGSAEPLIVNITENDGNYVMDKTFGEIRRAFMSGQTVFVVDSLIEEDLVSFRSSHVKEVDYNISSQHERATGTIHADQGYSATVSEAPYTLEALDAIFPYCN